MKLFHEAVEVKMESSTSRHRRSCSDSAAKMTEKDKFRDIFRASRHHNLDMGEVKNCVKTKKNSPTCTEVQNALKEEILQLQKQLENQFLARYALEKALSCKSFLFDPTKEKSITKPVEDLIKEITVLELEVVHLEKYLLSLYQRTFDSGLSSFPTVKESPKSNLAAEEVAGDTIMSRNKSSKENSSCFLPPQDYVANPPMESCGILGAEALEDSSIHRSHSSLSHCSAYSFRVPVETLAEGVDSHHSLPLSRLERAQVSASASNVSPAEHIISCVDHVSGTPNWLSEEMIKCISAIYCQLADPPLFNQDFPPSPISFSSSGSESSPQVQNDMWSSQIRENSSFNSSVNNPFHIEGSTGFTGPYFTMAEVQGIRRDDDNLRSVELMLQSFRHLISRLEEVDPKNMRHEEKLAFWINVHNALVMHALLVYGIPQGNLKRISLLIKAAYNVGGHTISVDMIQKSILGCRLPRPGQWLQSLFFPKTKFKAGDVRKAYAIEHPEPLLFFALCSGRHSDPMVRMYTAKRVFQELEIAKEEYIGMNMRAKEQKVFLPKIVDYFAKDLDLCPAGLMDMIKQLMLDHMRKNVQQQHQEKFCKKIEWLPHNFSFRYLLSNELCN